MIYTVASTFADAVRLAVADGHDQFWRNRLENGKLKDAAIDNARFADSHFKDAMRMELCTRHPGMFKVMA